jgi:hypothetical protein
MSGVRAARMVLALLALILASEPGPLMGQGGWRSYNVKNPYGWEGVDFTVRFPRDYVESAGAKPLVYKEFDIISENYIHYLSITILNVPTDIYLDINSNYISKLIEVSWPNLVRQLDGAQSYSTGFFNNKPYCDVKVVQSQLLPYQVYRYIEIRIIMQKNNKMISLQCGDIMSDNRLNNHIEHNKNVCQPFFNSLTFNE